ncbi:hypothetical protein FHL15_000328 [Xylaria flabelliformis]|uniref:Rhodopsin domain-containing protein n=1 Tax=Xylaria flabelliformis TaxID=2512241 RepID=A0A553IFK3_9PEZI|nr:hypothetical protein FHL15_000328 [Xylaria flabelliformis]
MAHTLTPEQIEQLRNSPAAAPPVGIIPNYDNPPNNNRLALAVIILGISVTTIAGLIRFYAKVFCTRRIRLEDYLGLVSFPFFLAGTWALTNVPKKPGYFVHMWDVRMVDLEGFLFTYVLSTTLYCVTLLLAKAAILLEWSHIFVPRPNRNGLWWICYGMLIANTALYIATIAALNYACSPQEKTWRQYLPGKCINFNVFNIFITIFHLVFDLLMLLLPHTVIWKLSLTTRQKIGVSVIFSVGSLACAWAAGRVVSAFDLTASQDKTYTYSQYIMWGIAEVTTAELIFCVPAFPLAFRPPNPLHSLCGVLWSKITMVTSSERISSTSTLPQLSVEPGQRDSSSYRRWQDEGSDAGLTELEPVRIQSGRPKDLQHDMPKITLGGILVTTEIDVRLETGKSSKGVKGNSGINQSEW